MEAITFGLTIMNTESLYISIKQNMKTEFKMVGYKEKATGQIN